MLTMTIIDMEVNENGSYEYKNILLCMIMTNQ